jgi:hypothetical protein
MDWGTESSNPASSSSESLPGADFDGSMHPRLSDTVQPTGRDHYGPMRNGRCSMAPFTTQRMVIVPSRLIEVVSEGVQHEWNPAGISGFVITLPARIHCRITGLLNNGSY